MWSMYEWMLYEWMTHHILTSALYRGESGGCYCSECISNLPVKCFDNGRHPTYSGENTPIAIFVEEQNRIPDLTKPEYGFI